MYDAARKPVRASSSSVAWRCAYRVQDAVILYVRVLADRNRLVLVPSYDGAKPDGRPLPYFNIPDDRGRLRKPKSHGHAQDTVGLP
jgi:hypothetical protein